MSKGWVDVEDLTGTLSSDESTPQLPSCLFRIPPQTTSASPSLLEFASGTDPIGVRLPIRVQKANFEHLLDLRVPRVARWFAYNLSRLRWLTSSDEEQSA